MKSTSSRSQRTAGATAQEASRLTAIRYLERVQEEAFLQLGTSADELNRWFEQNLLASAETSFISVAPDHPGPPEAWAKEQWVESVKAARDGGASRFELIPTYIVLQERILEIAAGASELGVRSPIPFVFGTVHAGRVNAEVLLPPGSEHAVLLFEPDLFTFCLLFSKAIVSAGLITIDGATITISDEPSIAERVTGSLELQEHFRAALEAYVIRGSPAAAPQYYALPEYANAARILWEGMERFTVAHEIQHLVAGHLSGPASRVELLPSRTVSAFVARREQELEADRLALPLALASAESLDVNVDFGFLAADLLLLCLDIADRAWAVLATGDDLHVRRATTHPSARDRRAAVRGEMRRLYPKAGKDSILLADTVAYGGELLWRQTKPHFRKLYVRGTNTDRRPKRA